MVLLALLSLVFTLVLSSAPLKSQSPNPYRIPPKDNASTQFLVFHSELSTTINEARTRCLSLGGDLVDVDSLPLLHYIAQHLEVAASIGSFLGQQHGGCLAIYPGAAVAIPQGGCAVVLSSICEVPIDAPMINKGMRKEGVTTSTIQIAGSIETNPVLPCCKCCA